MSIDNLQTTGSRINFVDLAKGICILLVISLHADIQHIIYFTPKISGYFGSFRMPLYFILAGLFVGFKSGKKLFIQKKINKLIIPFMFFVFLTNFFGWFVKELLPGRELGFFADEFKWVSSFQVAYYEFSHGLNNGPLWFFVCLFIAYIYYMIIDTIAKGNLLIKGGLCFFAGAIIYCLPTTFNLPFHLDTALSSIPFIFIGEYIRKKTKLLVANKYDKFSIPIAIVIFAIMIFTTPNKFHGHQNFFQLYFNGISGTLAILLISKQIKSLPIISYMGRYSLIFLGIHHLFIGHIFRIINFFKLHPFITELILITIIIGICYLISIVMRKWLPWFCAQKDLIYFIRPEDSEVKNSVSL